MSRVVLFLAFANDRASAGAPGSAGFLRGLVQEQKQLRAALADDRGRRTLGDERWSVVDVADATIDDVVTGLQTHRNRVAVFHYGGHAGDYELLLQSASGEPAVADAGGLARLLGAQRGLQLVFLNGCSTRGHVDELLAAGVPAVIATRRPVEDAIALDVARHFYGGLASGASLGRAFDEAMNAARAVVGGGVRPAQTRTVDTSEDDAPADALADRLPWELHVRPGAEVVREWSLGAAVGDPLFGLPPLEPRDLPPSPFRHLRWFTRADAELFFGRGAEIHTLYETLTSTQRDAPPVVLFYGQSGAGKSSLLDAGLGPRLEATHDVRYVRRDERLGLDGTLRAAFALDSSVDGSALRDAWRAQEADGGRPVVVILDQAEEAFSKPRRRPAPDAPNTPKAPDELDALVADLGALFRDGASRPDGRLVLSFRKEWLAEFAKRLADAHVPFREVFLDRLGKTGVLEVVTGPTRVARLRTQYGLRIVETGDEPLAEIVADDLLEDRASAVAPTLQVLLSKMWEHPAARRGDGRVFDKDLYQTLKADGILLSDFVDEQLGALEAWRPGTVDSGFALDLLHAHTTELVTARMRTAAQLATAYGGDGVRDVVAQCRDRYLLVDSAQARDAAGGAVPATTLAHDTLAPVVRRRFELSDRPGQRARRILEARAAEWADGATGRTLDAVDLKTVLDGQNGMRGWTPAEVRLVDASRVACARDERDRRWRRRAAYVAMIVIVALAAYATRTAIDATRQERRATALATFGASTGTEDRVTAALILARMDTTLEPVGALQHALDLARDPLPRFELDVGVPIRTVDVSDDGHILALGEDERVRVWARDARGAPLVLGDSALPIQSAAFRPGRGAPTVLITSYGDDTLRFVTLGRDVRTRRVALDGAAVIDARYSADGGRVFVSGAVANATMGADDAEAQQTRTDMDALQQRTSPDGRLRYHTEGYEPAQLWRADDADRTPLALRPAPDTLGYQIAFSADGRHAADVTADSLRLWSIDGGATRLTRVRAIAHPRRALTIQFAPDASAILTGDEDSVVRVYRVDGSQMPLALPHGDWAYAAKFTADGREIVTGSYDGKVRVWSAAGSPASVMHGEHRMPVRGIALSRDGTRLATASSDSTVRLWRADGTPTGFVLRQARPMPMRAVAFSPDGHRLVTASTDDTVRLWSADRLGPPATLGVHTDTIFQAVYSPDGRRVLTASRDGYAIAWSVDGRDPPDSLQHEAPVRGAVYSPDGRWIATAADSTVRLWRTDSLGAAPRVLYGHHRGNAAVRRVAFSPTGDRLVSAGTDQTARVWDVATGRPLATLLGHHAILWDANFSRDGRRIVTASEDSTVRVANADGSGTAVVLRGFGHTVRSAMFDPDDRHVITTSFDGTLRFTLIRWPDLLRYFAGATQMCLTTRQRVDLLREDAKAAAAAFARCERDHGRRP